MIHNSQDKTGQIVIALVIYLYIKCEMSSFWSAFLGYIQDSNTWSNHPLWPCPWVVLKSSVSVFLDRMIPAVQRMPRGCVKMVLSFECHSIWFLCPLRQKFSSISEVFLWHFFCLTHFTHFPIFCLSTLLKSTIFDHCWRAGPFSFHFHAQDPPPLLWWRKL